MQQIDIDSPLPAPCRTVTVRKGADMADTDGRYALAHTGAGERRRLDLFAERLYPLTKQRIGRLGLGPDASSLEVGGGRSEVEALD